MNCLITRSAACCRAVRSRLSGPSYAASTRVGSGTPLTYSCAAASAATDVEQHRARTSVAGPRQLLRISIATSAFRTGCRYSMDPRKTAATVVAPDGAVALGAAAPDVVAPADHWSFLYSYIWRFLNCPHPAMSAECTTLFKQPDL